MPYCFPRSYIKFQGHTGQNITDFDPNWAFPDCNSSFNSPMATKWSTIGRSQLSNPSDLPCSRSSVKFEGHTALKIVKFDPDWAFPDCNSSFNSPMATKWSTKLEVAWKRYPIVFQGHTSNCKVTWRKKSILTRIQRCRTGTPVWIHWWLWNDTQAWRSIKEVPYCFFRSSIKFQGYMGIKIDDLILMLSKIIRPVAAIKSLRFALFKVICQISSWHMQCFKLKFSFSRPEMLRKFPSLCNLL